VDDEELRDYLVTTKRDFGVTCRKFAGALTAEALRQELLARGLGVSQRDVFIRGVPIEIDLLVARGNVVTKDRILFEPGEIAAAIEVKYLGSFGERTIEATRRSFSAVCTASPRARCFYVTLFERRGYRGAMKSERLGHAVYTLFEYTRSEPNPPYHRTGDWDKLLHDLSGVGGN
jgi:hypothetical protein